MRGPYADSISVESMGLRGKKKLEGEIDRTISLFGASLYKKKNKNFFKKKKKLKKRLVSTIMLLG